MYKTEQKEPIIYDRLVAAIRLLMGERQLWLVCPYLV